MKKLAYSTLHGYGGDRIFAGPAAPGFGGAHLADGLLRDAFAARGVECHTPDMLPPGEFDGFFFRDMPRRDDPFFRYAIDAGKPMFLHVWENPFIHRPNADHARFRDFARVFSLFDDDVRLRGCVKLNYALPLAPPPADGGIPFGRRKLACMVSSLVKKNRPGCCSFMRLGTIRFYERFHPEDFDLWGANWGKGSPALLHRPAAFAALQALGIGRLLPRERHPCWRGECADKAAAAGACRFSYCYENSVKLPGYVTEKLFDAISAGAVPVYMAHPSDAAALPQGCFVDRAAFRDDAELHRFLASMPRERWEEYREEGRRFIASDTARRFSFKAYVDTLVSGIAPVLAGAGAA